MQEGSRTQKKSDAPPDELYKRLAKALEGRFFGEEAQRVNGAITFALELHKNQTSRADGPYVNHIMRVIERAVRFGGDAHTIIAAALHDSVEEHAEALAIMAEGTVPSLPHREQAFAYLRSRFGEEPCRIVQAVTNMEKTLEPDRVKRNALYATHLSEKIRNPRVLIVKLSDFLDNSLSLEAIEDSALQYRLARKYLPVYPLFIRRLQESDVPIAPEVAEVIVEALRSAWVVAQSIVERGNAEHKEAALP